MNLHRRLLFIESFDRDLRSLKRAAASDDPEARGIRRSLTHHGVGHVNQHIVRQGSGQDTKHVMHITAQDDNDILGPGIHSPPEWQ